MNVIVFGATGTVGRLAVQELLAAGHAVTAFARTPDRLQITHPALRRHAGDAMQAADVAAAMPGGRRAPIGPNFSSVVWSRPTSAAAPPTRSTPLLSSSRAQTYRPASVERGRPSTATRAPPATVRAGSAERRTATTGGQRRMPAARTKYAALS